MKSILEPLFRYLWQRPPSLLEGIGAGGMLFFRSIKVHRFIVSQIALLFLITIFNADLVFGQTESATDTTRVEREGPGRTEATQHNTILRMPYVSPIMPGQINRYQAEDLSGNFTFFTRLRDQSPEEMLFAEDPRYLPYGPEWERQLNENLALLLQATFKERNSFLNLLARLAPFMGFGFYERYEVPVVPRVEGPDRIYVEE